MIEDGPGTVVEELWDVAPPDDFAHQSPTTNTSDLYMRSGSFLHASASQFTKP